jgi:hypothetical protein
LSGSGSAVTDEIASQFCEHAAQISAGGTSQAVRWVTQMSHLIRADSTFSIRRFSQPNFDLSRHSDRRNHGFGRFTRGAIVGAQIKSNLARFDQRQNEWSATP